MEDTALKNSLYLLFIFIFFSCGTKQKESVEDALSYADFPQEKELKGEVIEIDTAMLRFPYRIRIEGDRAIVVDLHGADHYCHLFQYPSFKYLSSFCKRGDSPTDMLSMDNVRFYNNEVWTLDSNKNEVTRLGYSSSNDSLLRDEAVTLGEDILRPVDFVIYNDTTLIVPDYSGGNRLCWVNTKGKLLKKTGEIPTVDKEALQQSGPAYAQAWRSFFDYNSNNGVLASVTQLGEILEINNLKDGFHAVCIGKKGEPKFRVSSEGYGLPVGIMGFIDVQVTDNAIYAIFSGTTFKEIAKQSGRLPSGGKYIYVFSLTGEPICKYVLDHYVDGIWVDEATKTIMATDVNIDEPIVKFQFG